MMLIAESDPDLKYIEEILDGVFLIFPHFCLGRGLLEMAIDQAYYDAYMEIGFPQERDYSMLSWDRNGPNCLAMTLEAIVFFALVIGMQYNFEIKRSALKVERQSDDC